jgi:hypothetical protein
MPAIYAGTSLISLTCEGTADYLDPIRDCYEAFVLWMFTNLMITYLGGEAAFIHQMQTDGRYPTKHLFPVYYFFRRVDFSIPENFIMLKRTILQFVIIKPLHSLLVIVLKSAGVYKEGHIAADSAYIYVSLLYNISICVCLYALLMLYNTAKHDLKGINPVAKFLCIKGVIFFSFWQSLLLSILGKAGVFGDEHEEDTVIKVQDFLICLEMLMFSVAHLYAFGHKEFVYERTGDHPDIDSPRLQAARLQLFYAIKDAVGFNDLLFDLKHTLRGTNFLDTVDSHDSAPLLSPNNDINREAHFRSYQTPLQFSPEEEADPNMDRLYDTARQVGSDFNYKVVE